MGVVVWAGLRCGVEPWPVEGVVLTRVAGGCDVMRGAMGGSVLVSRSCRVVLSSVDLGSREGCDVELGTVKFRRVASGVLWG